MTPMDPHPPSDDASERYARQHALFEGARGLDALQRVAFLSQECGDDPALRAEVLGLLDALDDDAAGLTDATIEVLRAGLEQIVDDARKTPWLPDAIGAYRIEECIGQGGMGVVYLAHQDAPRRRVAVKLMHPMNLTEERRRRFRREAELLGRLRHPGIAHVLEFGTFDLGNGEQPFVAMELVEGVDLCTHAENAGLGVRARLELVARVADAIEHAHDRGVIHRDLKPENILVDATGQPKVLDFGVAYASGGLDEVSRVETRAGSILGTLAYMAPEQVEGLPDAITPRVDVYALGVVTFELLTGTLPRNLAGLSTAVAIRRVVDEPARPLEALRPELRGDVATIVATALAHDPARRYGSAAAFAADVRRHLDCRPISARPPSRAYLVGRFLQRNRALSLSVTALVLVLVAGVTVSTTQYLRARRSARLMNERYSEVLRLSDLKRLGDANEAAARLWPPHPALITGLEAWLAERAAPLEANLPRHRAMLDELRKSAVPGRAPWRFPNEELQWQHDTLLGLVDGLGAFLAPDIGTVASVRARLAFAKRIEHDTVTSPQARAEWDRAIALVRASDAYGGLELAPQIGLLPLGVDDASGLMEFWHVQSGARPERGATSAWRIADATGMVLVLVPGGTFAMGSQAADPTGPNYDPLAEPDEGPVRAVTLAPFLVSKFEMTQGQWRRAMGTAPSNYGPERARSESDPLHVRGWNHPVEQVSWVEAREALWRFGLELPTEAQWEYAGRAGTGTPWWCGSTRETIGAQSAGNVADQHSSTRGAPSSWPFEAWSDAFVVHAPVGSFAPNAFGLHDTIGNVWEWCQDGYGSYGETAPEDGSSRRVARGGSFGLSAAVARSAVRYSYTPAYRNDLVGVRAARSLTQER